MKLCRYSCGQFLEWNDVLKCWVNANTAIKHDCPTFHRKGRVETSRQTPKPEQAGPPKIVHMFDELQREIELALEHVINIANSVSKDTDYDIVTRPKDNRKI